MECMADPPTTATPSASAFEPTLVIGSWDGPTSFRPWAASLVLHVVVVSLLAAINPGTSSPGSPIVQLEDLLDHSDYQLVYHKFEDTLPAVTPKKSSPKNSIGAKARFKAPQTIVANDPDPQSSRQMIWTAEPAPKITQDIPSPNVLVWTPPDVPRLRFDVAKAESSRPENEALRAKAAPVVAAVVNDSIDLQSLQPIQRLRYQAEAAEQQRPNERALKASEAPEAPEVVAAHQATADLAEFQKFDALRYWTAEQKREAPKEQAALAGPAPKVAGVVTSGLNLLQTQPMAKPRFQMEATAAQGPVTEALERTQVPALADPLPAGLRGETGVNAILSTANASLAGIPPPPTRASSSASGGELGTARPVGVRPAASKSKEGSGGPAASSGTEGRALAVVGVRPSAAGKVPSGKRRGSFSASPNGGPGGQGVPGTPGTGSRVQIPNLSIAGRPSASLASVASLARTAVGRVSPEPFDRGAFLAKLRNRTLNDATVGDFDIEPTPENPEVGFGTRRVRTLAINMPNINSSAGSWIVRFPEAEGFGSQGKILPPAPRIKVDPTYARAAISERIEGEVILSAVIRNDGAVDHVKLIKSVDERLDTAAIAALGKWKFHPALRAGVPVDIEVVVRIPFRLKPLEDR